MDVFKLPILYMGPYHFKLAPVEMFFNYIKNRDLNPLRSRMTTLYVDISNLIVREYRFIRKSWQCTSADYNSTGFNMHSFIV
jgi:hypothetical protein